MMLKYSVLFINQLIFKFQMISKTKPKQNNLLNSQIYQKILEQEHYEREEHSAAEYPPHSQSQQQNDKIEMIIEYGNNKTATLWVGPEDQPTTLAKRFCYKYNIDPHVINTLASNIRTLQINSFNEQRSSFKIQKNNTNFDDKQNNNRSNIARSRSKSHQKMSQFSKLKSSRNKTNQSNTIIQSNTSRYNVFDRLYKDSKRKATKDNNANQSKRSESRMSLNVTANNRSLNQSSIQSCLQIYQKNTKLKEDLQRQNQHLQELKQLKQIQKCSFKPQINPLSNLIAAKLRELDQSSIVNRSTNDRQMTKIKEYLLKKQEQEMKQCTFKPKIINKMAKQSSSFTSTQRYMQLHNEHYERQAKKKAVGEKMIRQTEQSHKPAINRISKIIVKENFFQRLEKDVQKRIQKKQSVQKIVSESRVQRRPSTGRPPANRSKGEKTIGDYLYQMSKKSRALSTKEQPQILTDPKSNQLHNRSKQLAVQYIFELLDSDQDGLISSMRISISALPQQVLRLLAPLLSEMEEVGVQLNSQQFSMAFQRLYSTFSIAQKNIILKVYKNKEMDSRALEIPNFTPNLNEYSLKIARELCSDDVDIYENSLMRMKQKENKLNRMRAQRMLDEYSECTFHPKIHH